MATRARGTGGDLEVTDDYQELLDTLDTLLEEALRKVESGRVYDPENERVRIKWIRVAKDVVAEKRKVKADRDLEELRQELEEIKAAQDADAPSEIGVT